jgi:hypothetical protein
MTSALDGGEWSTSRPGRSEPETEPPVPTGYEAGWDPKPDRMLSKPCRPTRRPLLYRLCYPVPLLILKLSSSLFLN